MHIQREEPCEGKKGAVYKSQTVVSPEANPANPLILNFQPPEVVREIMLMFKSSSLWHFVMETQVS